MPEAGETVNVNSPPLIEITAPNHDPSNDDGIVDGEGVPYQRYSDDFTLDHGCDCVDARESCGRFAAFQAKYLGPLSPDRAPGSWMIINIFSVMWSLSLGIYSILIYFSEGNEEAAVRATSTHYLLYSLSTTLVWVVEVSLRAAFPGLDTVLVVSTPAPSDDDDEEEAAPARSVRDITSGANANANNNGLPLSPVAGSSIVTIEKVVQKRSKKQQAVIATELILALFFTVETTMDCWRHWQARHGDEADDDEYYNSMLQQQSDIWINALAYVYMTYETYHDYYRLESKSKNLQRSISSTLLSQQMLQQSQHQQNGATRITLD